MASTGKGYGYDTIRLPILGKPYRTVSTSRIRTVSVPYLPYLPCNYLKNRTKGLAQ
jgi:hypothetical protein